MLDLAGLAKGNPVNDSHEPREIFQALPKQAGKFQYPRDVQADVWEKWHSLRSNTDNIIKMNTGSGKTAVGLLILKSSLNEKVGPAVYVVPDNYLVAQVKQEADLLGIKATLNEKDPQFLCGDSILIINIHKLFNGKSVFGVGDEGIKKTIGSILIDDAHACLDTVEEQFTMRIPRQNSMYEQVFNIFADSLKQQNEVKMHEIAKEDPAAFIHVPFWAWKEKLGQVTQTLVANKNCDDIRFTYPMLKNDLNQCHCVIGSRYIEISPYYIPTSVIAAYASAKRRIFMTATLSDNGVLATHFGVEKSSLQNEITPKTAGDVGERMIIFPQVVNSQITDDEIKAACVNLAKTQNVVVIVPSRYRATYWEDIANLVLDSSNMVQGVASLKYGHVGLAVLINRYDGVDLPQNACRVLVIDSLPNVSSLIGKVNQSVLLSNDLVVTNHIQKIEQGMGRGIRSNDDYCVVLLMGNQLTNALYNHQGLERFSPATRAQIELSNSISDQLRGKPMAEIVQAMDYCLTRVPEWMSVSQSHLSKLVYDKQSTGLNVELFEAFRFGQKQDFNAAAKLIETLANQEHNDGIKGYLKQQLAVYTNNFDEVAAQQILQSACKLNQRVIKPLAGFNYKKLEKRARTQAEECSFILSKYHDKGRFLIYLNSLLGDLKFMPNSANRFESSLQQLGELLGFGSQRPENDYNVGPDNLWCVGDNEYLVIECKNEAVVPTVTKTYCNQLNGSGHWFERNYHGMNSTLILIHPSNSFEKAASPAKNMRVINEPELELLTKNVRNLFEGMVQQGQCSNIELIRQQLVHYGLDKQGILKTYTKDVHLEK